MEHFVEKDIRRIFREFHRVLKRDGYLLLFWPPRYGSSVLFLRGIQHLSRLLLGRYQSLHPSEPSLLPSREYIERLGAECGFRLVEYAFTWRDLYTYAVVVLEK
jgi:SAM-dependent methyltransferase